MKQPVEFNNYQLLEETQKLDELILDNQLVQYNRIKVKVVFTKDNDLYYIRDGQILRMQILEVYKLQQRQNDDPLQNRYNTYNGKESIVKVMKKLENGRLDGKEKLQLMLEANTAKMEKNRAFGKIQYKIILTQVYECGVYYSDKKQGEWKYLYEEEKIGGGIYNQMGQKNGKWIDLSDGFMLHTQVTYSGEYKNDIKIGLWDVWLKHKYGNSSSSHTWCMQNLLYL
ncbi:unnamed protein product (macronuclear) [Paramecium tetraurelia]|uniref:Uncharacterized protein n=1 Tax=Paramecium tetraurelia TaxID=5888 RepID=A0D943_PARTE|nr:uncharacterized protein GSPATT00014506001 [Paramecium tetraurelia]CAK79560.1 unnamed protein product [Paramecium tetraurelia]|eukprot:XP_001446957.1 hypothetical protein (macronuclear) [Paramecium tetraurelia strain d4-2]